MYQDHGNESQILKEVEPRSFEEIIGLWPKIFRMNEAFFSNEVPRVSGTKTLVGVLVYAVIAAANAMLTTAMTFSETVAYLPTEYNEFFPSSTTFLMFSLCAGLIGTPITFYLGNGVLYTIARLFGGQGDFATQAYLQSLYLVPMGIIMVVLYFVSLVPLVGNIIYYPLLFAMSIFGIVLSIRSTKVAHRFSTGKALLTIFTPLIVVVILIACIMAVTFATFDPGDLGTFTNIDNLLPI